MSASLINLHVPETIGHSVEETSIVGKDILELLSSSMYVDPLPYIGSTFKMRLTRSKTLALGLLSPRD